MEASFHLLVSLKDQENVKQHSNSNTNNNNLDNIKRKLINDTCQGVVMGEKAKVLNLHSKQPDQEAVFTENLKIYGTSLTSVSSKKSVQRQVQSVPEKILDAPDYLDDFCKWSRFYRLYRLNSSILRLFIWFFLDLNLIDWSSTNNLAVALNKDLYIWNATTKDIYQLMSLDENSNDYISSVSWIQKGNILAVGNSKSVVELWDVNKKVCLRQMKSHKAQAANRVGSLAWNSHLLCSGSRLVKRLKFLS